MAKLVVGINYLATLYPEIAEEWHTINNGSLTPDSLAYGSSKKVWWQCQDFGDHIYESAISERPRKDKPTGYSFCASKKISPEKSLAFLSPEIAKEWHSTKNGSLTPKDVFNFSNKKVWWQFSKVKEHSWKKSITSRTEGGTGCNICDGNEKYSKRG